jgi:hypothetical protein
MKESSIYKGSRNIMQCVYEGNWKNNLKDGKGIEYEINGSYYFSGEWKGGLRVV